MNKNKNFNIEVFLNFLINNPNKIIELETLKEDYNIKFEASKNEKSRSAGNRQQKRSSSQADSRDFLIKCLIPFARENGFYFTVEEYEESLNYLNFNKKNSKTKRTLNKIANVAVALSLTPFIFNTTASSLLTNNSAHALYQADFAPIACTNVWSFNIPVFEGRTNVILSGANFNVKYVDLQNERAWIYFGNNPENGGFIETRFLVLNDFRGKLKNTKINVYSPKNPFKSKVESVFDLDYKEQVNGNREIQIFGFSGDFVTVMLGGNNNLFYIKTIDFVANSFKNNNPRDLKVIKKFLEPYRAMNIWNFSIPVYNNYSNSHEWDISSGWQFVIYDIEGEKAFISRDHKYSIPLKFTTLINNAERPTKLEFNAPKRIKFYKSKDGFKNFDLRDQDFYEGWEQYVREIEILGIAGEYLVVYAGTNRVEPYFVKKQDIEGYNRTFLSDGCKEIYGLRDSSIVRIPPLPSRLSAHILPRPNYVAPAPVQQPLDRKINRFCRLEGRSFGNGLTQQEIHNRTVKICIGDVHEGSRNYKGTFYPTLSNEVRRLLSNGAERVQLFVNGDFTFRGEYGSYHQPGVPRDFLNFLREINGNGRVEVFISLGNHEVSFSSETAREFKRSLGTNCHIIWSDIRGRNFEDRKLFDELSPNACWYDSRTCTLFVTHLCQEAHRQRLFRGILKTQDQDQDRDFDAFGRIQIENLVDNITRDIGNFPVRKIFVMSHASMRETETVINEIKRRANTRDIEFSAITGHDHNEAQQAFNQTRDGVSYTTCGAFGQGIACEVG